jgi:N-methylhydantoinase A
VRRYLKSLINRLKGTGYAGPVLMMQSSGGILDAELILGKPAQIVESGPAAGVVGAAHVARLSGYHDVITLDMGGTTAKAALIENGALTRTEEYEVGGGISLSSRLVKGGGYALKLPVIDVSEVGAGGGSVVWLDPAGSLKVGPESMGAVPGPACYDAGGAEPTVTDANVVLGYLNPGALAGGTIPINASKSRETIRDKIAEPLGRHLLEAAYAVHAVANANMTRAVKAVSTYRGRDPRDFTIFAFGGNGGIHGAAIARILGIKRVVVPPAAGVFSALGLLFADIEVWEACALMQPLLDAEPQRVEAAYRELRQKVLAQIGHPVPDVRFQRMADLRYAGQAFEISVPLEDRTIDDTALQSLATAFENEYEKTYGHRLPGGSPIQFVGIRLSGMVRPGGPRRMDPARVLARNDGGAGRSRPAYFGPELGEMETPVLTRAALVGVSRRGPAIVEEYEGTIVVPPYASVSIDPQANVVIDLD